MKSYKWKIDFEKIKAFVFAVGIAKGQLKGEIEISLICGPYVINFKRLAVAK